MQPVPSSGQSSAGRRVRHHLADAVRLAAFSLAVSIAVTGVLSLLSRLMEAS